MRSRPEEADGFGVDMRMSSNWRSCNPPGATLSWNIHRTPAIGIILKRGLKKMTVKLKDIAEKVGVNVSTVSRVLNNRGYISQELRGKVFSAMEQLNYHPNEVARSLLRKRSNVIGLVVPAVAHPFFGELCQCIENYAYTQKYRVMLCNSQHDKEKELSYLTLLKANQVDGIIMASQTIDVEEFAKIKLPVVTIEREIDHIPYISSDNYEGGRLAAELLIAKGCRKIAMITGSLGLNMLSNLRYAAFVNVTAKHDVWHTTVQTDINGFDPENYDTIIEDLLTSNPDIDGIFASSDLIAAHIIKICHYLNKAIPAELKIVGYDGIPFGELTVPPLTTIRQPVSQMGRLAMDLLIKQINKLPVDTKNILPVTLIERQTT
jgi:LacI family sucrose operon transcriptional repressor